MNKEATIFIDTQDIEERYGEQLYQEYLEKENKELKEKVNQLETNIDEAIEYIKHSWRLKFDQVYDTSKNLSGWEAEELLSILERGKE